MIYILLLRGINVGGNNKVPMHRLKEVLEEVGCTQVKTYINSGNVLLSDKRDSYELHDVIKDSLKKEFRFEIDVLLIEKQSFDQIAAALPTDWHNDNQMRCDVMFLWKEMNTPSILKSLPIKSGIDTVKYVDGALIWKVSRDDATKSGLSKLVGSELYRKMTIRNCNTVRKLADMV